MKYKYRYRNRTKQNAYENACDCHYYGFGPGDWNDCGIPAECREELWRLAFWDMAEGDIEHGTMIDDVYHFYDELGGQA